MREYKPVKGGLAYRVIEYFIANPEEELDTNDVATKFGVHDIQKDNIAVQLQRAVDAGMLVKYRPEGARCAIYAAGPKLRVEAHYENKVASVPIGARSEPWTEMVQLPIRINMQVDRDGSVIAQLPAYILNAVTVTANSRAEAKVALAVAVQKVFGA